MPKAAPKNILTIDRYLEQGSIYSVYQPIVEIESEEIFAYEALSRNSGKWEFPQELFRAAYEEGYAMSLDLHCMETSLQIASRLPKGKMLFVNVEPMTVAQVFRKGMHGERILKNVKRYSSNVVFELTEGMKARDFGLVKQGTNFMQELGFKFALDDVSGIGLKLLKLMTLKPAFMKLDMGLIQGLSRNRMQQELVRHLIEIARSNKALLVAEGIEQPADLDIVTKFGIPYAQGFYFAKPNRAIHKDIAAYRRDEKKAASGSKKSRK